MVAFKTRNTTAGQWWRWCGYIESSLRGGGGGGDVVKLHICTCPLK